MTNYATHQYEQKNLKEYERQTWDYQHYHKKSWLFEDLKAQGLCKAVEKVYLLKVSKKKFRPSLPLFSSASFKFIKLFFIKKNWCLYLKSHILTFSMELFCSGFHPSHLHFNITRSNSFNFLTKSLEMLCMYQPAVDIWC